MRSSRARRLPNERICIENKQFRRSAVLRTPDTFGHLASEHACTSYVYVTSDLSGVSKRNGIRVLKTLQTNYRSVVFKIVFSNLRVGPTIFFSVVLSLLALSSVYFLHLFSMRFENVRFVNTEAANFRSQS